MKRIWSLYRFPHSNGTWGVLVVPGLGQFVTVEAPWHSTGLPGVDAGTPFKSCLPQGLYSLQFLDSAKYGKDRIHLIAPGIVSGDPGQGTPRSDCLFHDMTKPSHSKGCVGVGEFVVAPLTAADRIEPRIAKPTEARLSIEAFMKRAPDYDHQLLIRSMPGFSYTVPEKTF